MPSVTLEAGLTLFDVNIGIHNTQYICVRNSLHFFLEDLCTISENEINCVFQTIAVKLLWRFGAADNRFLTDMFYDVVEWSGLRHE